MSVSHLKASTKITQSRQAVRHFENPINMALSTASDKTRMKLHHLLTRWRCCCQGQVSWELRKKKEETSSTSSDSWSWESKRLGPSSFIVQSQDVSHYTTHSPTTFSIYIQHFIAIRNMRKSWRTSCIFCSFRKSSAVRKDSSDRILSPLSSYHHVAVCVL